jgi:exopolyphosphatase/guanosine-5'-triphosphate,3'-diphosphate pyrophosphatase
MILAGIDIGTNTLRLLVAETGPDSFHEIYAERTITRLGQDLDLSGKLTREAEERSLKVLKSFAEKIRAHTALHTAAIGTSALRNASNSEAFIHAVKINTGIDITVVSGKEEARLTWLGVARMLSGSGALKKLLSPAPLMVIDIGGGSTEIMMTRPGEAPVSVSLPLGAVYLTEQCVQHDPPTTDELAVLRGMVRERLDRFEGTIQPAPDSTVIGTAGTITTLAAIDQGMTVYDPERITRFVLTGRRIEAMIATLSTSTIAERRKIPGLEPGREDIIPAGAIILQEIMRRFGYTSLLVSDWGLREGIVLDLYERITQQEPPKRQYTDHDERKINLN